MLIDGKHIYLGPYGSAKSREKYARLIAERNQGELPQITAADGKRYPDLLMAELLVKYIEWADTYYKQDGKSTGEVMNIGYALRPLRALYASMPARDFGPKALKTVQQYMIEDEDLCRTLINSRIGSIKRMFGWAVSEELIPPGVFEALRTVRGLRFGRTDARETEPVRPVADAWIEKTICFLPPQVAAMVRLQRLTGMRPEDVCGIRAKDINLSEDIWLFEPEGHKNRWRGHSRVLPIGPQAQEVIRPLLVDRAIDAHLFSPIEVMEWRQEQRRKHRSGRKTKIYPSETKRLERERKARKNRGGKGKRVPRSNYVTKSYYRAVQYAIEQAAKAGVVIPSWSPNQLRHARGTEVRKTHGLEAAQAILGHRKADVTQLYAERDLGLAIEIAKMTG